jgi:hypothetical protein
LVAGCLALALPGSAASPDRTVLTFDVPAGDVDTTLRKFAVQSGQQMIYPTRLAEGVQTQAVKGRFTAREALDRMLADTTLSAWQDEQTGALAVGLAARNQRPIELPPFLVEEAAPVPWRYAQMPGAEILSRCTDEVTTELMVQNQSLQELLEIILPKRLQMRSVVPTTFIFFSDGGQAGVAPDLLATLRHRAVEIAVAQAASGVKPAVETTVGALPNFRFWDQDALCIFYIWEELNQNRGRLMLSPGYVRYVLDHRTPTLPSWFVEGMAEFYRSVRMNTALLRSPSPAYATPSRGPSQGTYAEPLFGDPSQNSISVRRAAWVSEKATQVFRDNALKPELLPLADVFAERLSADALTPAIRSQLALAGETDPDLTALWRSQAALFIRWALCGPEARKQALWQFVERTAAHPATEAIFRECFGLTYWDAELQLGVYARSAFRNVETLHPPKLPELLWVALRDADPAEISRIKGDFNRLEIAYVREFVPQLTEKYIEQARQVLRKSYDAGDRDARLLAELGLCECDANNDAAARPFLEAAVKAKVERPRAYYELARIRFAEARARARAGQLTPEQLAGVLQPLSWSLNQTPALRESYELMAEAWLRSTASPTPEQLAVLRESVHLFPRSGRLIFSVALLNATHGHQSEAQALIAQGLAVSTDRVEIARFEKLQAAVNAAPGTTR